MLHVVFLYRNACYLERGKKPGEAEGWGQGRVMGATMTKVYFMHV